VVVAPPLNVLVCTADNLRARTVLLHCINVCLPHTRVYSQRIPGLHASTRAPLGARGARTVCSLPQFNLRAGLSYYDSGRTRTAGGRPPGLRRWFWSLFNIGWTRVVVDLYDYLNILATRPTHTDVRALYAVSTALRAGCIFAGCRAHAHVRAA